MLRSIAKLLRQLAYQLEILPERRAYRRTDTCDRLSYLARTGHY